jgi:hypothetical protein
MNSMVDFVVDILLLKLLHTKSLEQDIIGPQSFQMCINLLENVSLVSFSQESKKVAALPLQPIVVEAPFQQ